MEQILKERGQFDLNICFFDDLFNSDELSCIDQPIVACAGIYGSDYKNNIATCPWEKR